MNAFSQILSLLRWERIRGKPTTFPPETHTHSGDDITSAVGEAAHAGSADTATNADYANAAASADSVLWDGIIDKPMSFPPSAHNHDTSYVLRSEMGAASGVATLDATGKVPSTQLPSSPSGALTGEIKMYGGSSAPSGFLLCDGASYLRADYADLFAVIGTAFGSVDANHFNVPDMRGRTPAGLDTTLGGSYADRLTSGGSGINGRTLGAAGGVETVTLYLANLPAHTHTLNHGHSGNSGSGGAHQHYVNLTTSTNGSHYHNYWQCSQLANHFSYGPSYYYGVPQWQNGTTDTQGNHNHSVTGYTDSAGAHTHVITVGDYAGDSGAAGSTSPLAMQNTQPTLVVNFIIKT